ncbi:ATP-binding cassette domain-containing protein [Streptomyces sp. A012304]|uniref:ATP-binding cassette domain-containing protein n=1 Tax=Streptomyces sp. A012304 TaxID=375446 RepID=UPI002231A315|nr:ATP-binding cassette domain-containing protein [Streptomyces sp. A012304]GKQ39420.1 ABC transporter ATP-binding protein [Streptomyces sp. A012304]
MFSGKPYRDLRHPMREVGTLLDAKAFHPTRKARSHLRMLAAAAGVPDARVDEVLHLVGLESVAKKQPKGFSLGMGQRLGLAAALLGDPHTLILDEPANGLDPQGINWLRGFLKDFAASGRSVFVSSHLLAEMALMADHLVVIGKGRMIANESVADFVTKSSRSVVVVQSPRIDELAELLLAEGAGVERVDSTAIAVSGADRASIGELAYAHQIMLHELTDRAATLEEAFLDATADAEQFVATSAAPRSMGEAAAASTPDTPEGTR